MKIAFVGTGVMGKSMVANLLKAGHEVVLVVVHNRGYSLKVVAMPSRRIRRSSSLPSTKMATHWGSPLRP